MGNSGWIRRLAENPLIFRLKNQKNHIDTQFFRIKHVNLVYNPRSRFFAPPMVTLGAMKFQDEFRRFEYLAIDNGPCFVVRGHRPNDLIKQ
jgi:hypothetical protein